MAINNDNQTEIIIEQRIKKDLELFFVDYTIETSKFGLNIIKKKTFYGVLYKGEIVVPVIYDDIVIITNTTVAVKVNNKYSLYDIHRNEYITTFSYTSLQCIGSYWKLNNNSNNMILFDTLRRKILNISDNYDEYNLKCDNTEYCWARRGRYFDFIHRSSGNCISLPGIVLAYDTEFGMFGKDEVEETVSFFDEFGVEDSYTLRKIVAEAGGYLTLINYTYNIEHIIDVYGNILNI